jgi:hypothetical protein
MTCEKPDPGIVRTVALSAELADIIRTTVSEIAVSPDMIGFALDLCDSIHCDGIPIAVDRSLAHGSVVLTRKEKIP